MSELNVATLEASQKLYEAGIVLETDAVWVKWYSDNYPHGEYRLVYKASVQIEEFNEQYPAPSMAEVWRELPEKIEIICLLTIEKVNDAKGGYDTLAFYRGKPESMAVNSNPADALIELLIWLKEQNRERIVKKLIDHADKLKW